MSNLIKKDTIYLMGSSYKKGFGLIETVVGVAVFLIIAVSAYGAFFKILEGVKVLRVKNAAANLANEQIEIVRNLPYTDVGIVNGLPPGKIPRIQQIERAGIMFEVETSVRDIDDPFDGQIGGNPNDLSPADYKMVEIAISCDGCRITDPLKFYTRVSPLALETTGNNGAIFVQVFDASGQPVQGADVHIENNQEDPPIVIDETTDNNGLFQIVNAPPAVGGYEITVSNGQNYSVDQTYQIGDPSNPVPIKPHANVLTGQVTQISFAIDKLSELDIYTRKNTCERIPNISFNMKGAKLIGENVHKYNKNLSTNSNGFLSIKNIEWDDYLINLLSSSWNISGSSHVFPIKINPGINQMVDLILSPKNGKSILIKVLDGETMLPVSDATVKISRSGFEEELVTGRGFLNQTDWSGGAGQEDFSDQTRFFNSTNINYLTPTGQISLSDFMGSFDSNGFLESSIFDMGTTTNFGNIFWEPANQPPSAGPNPVRFQIATNEIITATSTWSFVGPDGSAGTFYLISGEPISSVHNGDRYLKYKTYLQTVDNSVTPIVANVSFTFTTECLPPGQVFFDGLNTGNYEINVEHANYQDVTLSDFQILEDWVMQEIILSPY